MSGQVDGEQDVDEQDQGDAGNASADEGRPAETPRGASRPASVGGDGAGWVLGLILWAGVVLPFIKGGPGGVKAWWLAKFLNKAPDGSELP